MPSLRPTEPTKSEGGAWAWSQHQYLELQAHVGNTMLVNSSIPYILSFKFGDLVEIHTPRIPQPPGNSDLALGWRPWNCILNKPPILSDSEGKALKPTLWEAPTSVVIPQFRVKRTLRIVHNPGGRVLCFCYQLTEYMNYKGSLSLSAKCYVFSSPFKLNLWINFFDFGLKSNSKSIMHFMCLFRVGMVVPV